MADACVRHAGAVRTTRIGRRTVLQGALTLAGGLGIGLVPRHALAVQRGSATSPVPDSTLALARFLNRAQYGDLPPKAIEHAKMILASTLASAAPGSLIDSARILARWRRSAVAGRRRPCGSTAPSFQRRRRRGSMPRSATRPRPMTATFATRPTKAPRSRRLVWPSRNERAPRARICWARWSWGTRPPVVSVTLVALAVAVCMRRSSWGSAARRRRRLLKLTDEQMAHALGIVATTVGGLAIGTNSWAREYMGANAASTAVEAAPRRRRAATRSTRTCSRREEGSSTCSVAAGTRCRP